MVDIKLRIDPPIRGLIEELEALQAGLGEKGIRSGLVRAVNPVKAAMKGFAPERRGSLKEAIGHTSISKRAKQRLGVDPGTAAILVGANRKIAVNGKKVWQGLKAHWMEGGTKHMGARPFMARGLAAGESGFESRFYQGLTAYVEKQRAKRHPR